MNRKYPMPLDRRVYTAIPLRRGTPTKVVRAGARACRRCGLPTVNRGGLCRKCCDGNLLVGTT